MDSIIETFQIDWKQMIAQVVNFAIVATVLWFFAVKPLLKIMKERTEKIEKSLADADRIEKSLAETEVTKQNEMIKMKKEAQLILEQANQVAEKNKKEIVEQAQQEVNKVKVKAREEIQSAKEQMLQEVKKEVADLVIMTTKKVINKELNTAEQKNLINQTIKEL